MSAVEQPLIPLPVMNEQQQALLRDSHGPVLEQALDPAFNVVTQFEQHAAATPNAIACYAGTQSITYGDLNIQANRLAHHLIALGVGSESVVGVYIERSIETLVALLAIFKAGGAYVPLDVNYPQHYLELMIENAGLSQVICNNSTKVLLPPISSATVNIDTLADALARQSELNPGVTLLPEQLAYILYTSGSTGTPKGVEVPQAQVTNCLQNYCTQYPLDTHERVAQRTTTAFAVSLKELFAALVSGASVVIVADVSKDPARLAAAIKDYGVTRLSIVPSHLEALLGSGADIATSLSTLRYCITAGEPLPKRVADRVKQLLPATRLLNNYGCTECNDITYQDVFALDGQYQFVPVGFPIANTEIYVLDAQLQPVPIGVPGELCVAGQSVPKGYRGRPDLTAEKFIDHPFSTIPGKRLFKTGDYVKRLASGALEYLGRQDLQVKVRGSRVDARQVEYVMSLYPGVNTPIASHSPEGDQLLGYFTEKPESPVDRVQFKRYLSAQLPSYMVPDIILRLDNLPRLPNGKVDRRNLPSPMACMSDNENIVAPETDTEKTVAAIWAKVLNMPVGKIGRDDNFFDLGGHSLGAIRLLAALKSEFLYEISLKEFFDSRDLKQLSENIDKRIALVLSVIELMDQPEMLEKLCTKTSVPHQLETERLILRPLCESDWQSLYRYLSDPIATRYTLNKEFSTLEAWYVVCSMIGHWQIRGYGPYAIEHKETKTMMGIAGFWYPLDWPGPEIKWALVREYWGKGFASEAARAILAVGKNSLPDISWISVIHDENAASVRVAEALGGVFEESRSYNNAKWRTYRYR